MEKVSHCLASDNCLLLQVLMTNVAIRTILITTTPYTQYYFKYYNTQVYTSDRHDFHQRERKNSPYVFYHTGPLLMA